ncbi:MAG: TraB/GumN family protein, partial [Spirochaeta sp.]
PLPEFIYDIFESSDSLILEVNIAEAGPDAFFGAQSLMEYPDGQSLENDLSESEIELLTDILGKLGIPFDMVKHLKPWVIEATLVTTLAQQHGIQAEYGIDMHFAELAEDLDMPVIALETIEEQLNLLGSLDTETQAAQLMRSVENYQDISEYVQELLQIWRNGDLQGMEDSIAESLLSDPELQPYYESMFTRRNHAWARTLIEELETPGDSFVVVGSGHLVGPENVIEILRDAGYQAVRF